MSNRLENSPIGVQDADMWSQIPETPGVALSKLGNKGHLYISGKTVCGLAETTDGDFVFCWFDGDDRKDSGVRTDSVFQYPAIDGKGRALVIGKGGKELFAVEPSGQATSVGKVADEEWRFAQAGWLSNGFVAGDNHGYFNVYRWSDGEAPTGVGRFNSAGGGFDEFRSTLEGDLIISCSGSEVHVYSVGQTDLRLLADMALEFRSNYQCLDETGRAMFTMPGAHITDHGAQFELTQVLAALDKRDELPAMERIGDALELTAGAGVAAAAETAAAPAVEIREPRTSEYWTYTNALLAMMKQKATRLDEPLPGVVECLAMPMDDELYAYIHFRAHHQVGVVAIYEAWLDQPPKLEGDRIALGVIANGDPIYVRGRQVIELSHEGDGEREYGSFESWLSDVCFRTEDGTDLDPYLKKD